ncbi:hypothetical protein D3C81_1121000 [compost metagenome]
MQGFIHIECHLASTGTEQHERKGPAQGRKATKDPKKGRQIAAEHAFAQAGIVLHQPSITLHIELRLVDQVGEKLRSQRPFEQGQGNQCGFIRAAPSNALQVHPDQALCVSIAVVAVRAADKRIELGARLQLPAQPTGHRRLGIEAL